MIKSTPLRWHGGKSYLAAWIHSLAPPSCIDDPVNGYTHRNIAYAGGLGEFWNWQPVEGISETVNDLNYELTDFWKVLSCNDGFAEFSRLVAAVPFSEYEWKLSKDEAGFVPSRVATAVRFFIRYRQSRQGLGKDYATPTTRTRRGMNENVSAWLSAVDGLPECHERLRRVEMRCMDAIDFIQAYDHPRALFYLDPPYLHETRNSTGEYGPNEMTRDQHHALLDVLGCIKGKFMLSGYPDFMYDEWAEDCGWNRHEKQIDNKASSSKTKEKKTEVIWTNY